MVIFGRNYLVCTDGKDRLVGSAGHDILVAGEVATSFSEAALRAVLAEWVANKAPDTAFEDDVLDEAAVIDDDYDILTGGSGADWFIISTGDKVTDFNDKKTLEDLLTTL